MKESDLKFETLPKSEARSKAIPRLLRRLLALQGLFLLVASTFFSSVNIPISRFRVESSVIVSLGLIALFISIWKNIRPPILLFSNTFLGLLITITVAGYHAPMRAEVSYGLTHFKGRVHISDDEWIDLSVGTDNKVGFKYRTNSVIRHHTLDYDVSYKIGPDGFRVMPLPATQGSLKEIWFLGCSFTFGSGVEDEKTYPYLLASHAWPDYKIRNFAINGQGTTNAYLQLKESLAAGSSPKLVMYGWIENHLKRNYLRKSWFQRLNISGIPKFELKNGQLQYFGLVPGDNSLIDDSPELDKTEFQITVALIREMSRLCREKHIPFVVLLLHGQGNQVPAELSGEPGLSIIDLRHIKTDFFPNDGHPKASWHHCVAHAIASSPLLESLTGESRLYAPEAFSLKSWPFEYQWNLWPGPGEPLAKIEIDPANHNRFGIRMLSGAKRSEVWHVQLKMPTPLKKDLEYIFEADLKSDQARSLVLGVLENHKPYDHLAEDDLLQINKGWQRFQKKFKIAKDEHDAQIVLSAGASLVSWEIRNTRLLMDGKEMDFRQQAKLFNLQNEEIKNTETKASPPMTNFK